MGPRRPDLNKDINDDKSWERCYVLLKILFPCLRVLRLEDSNLSGMENKLLFENDKTVHREKKSDLDYQRVLPDISSPANISNISDDESDEEESISKNLTLYSENVCFVICSL